jgi:hypothetical protein
MSFEERVSSEEVMQEKIDKGGKLCRVQLQDD